MADCSGSDSHDNRYEVADDSAEEWEDEMGSEDSDSE